MSPASKSAEVPADRVEPAGDVLARHGRSFHLASRFLDRETAQRAARLYRFCRHVDDIADECSDPRVGRSRLAAIAGGLRSDEPVDAVSADFLALAAETGMSLEPALELIAGVGSDLDAVRIADAAELHRYCFRVAGTVGLMMCAVLGVDDPSAAPFAIDLGMAMQLTNIARDVEEDAAMDRRYLPASIVGELEPEAILWPGVDEQPRLRNGVHWLLDEADRFYTSGRAGLVFLPDRARLGIRVAAGVYGAIGDVLGSWGHAPWRGRAVVSRRAKAGAAARAGFAELAARRSRSVPIHDAALHRSLAGLTGIDTERLVAVA